jgi:hypothetical protein
MSERVSDATLNVLSRIPLMPWFSENPAVGGALLRVIDEVQQARQRRCGNCADHRLEPGPTWRTADVCDRHSRSTAFLVSPDWFCADFTPKESK